MVLTHFRVIENTVLVTRGIVGRMSRSPNAPEGRTASMRVFFATICTAVQAALLAGGSAPAAAQVNITITKPATPPKLTLESAQPLPVPPRPDIRTPKPVKAPPRFTAPVPLEAPPTPELAVGVAPPPPAPPAGAPPVKTAAAPPPQAPLPQAPATAQPPTASSNAAPPPPARTQTAALPPPPPAVPPAASAPKAAPLTVVFDGAATSLPEPAETALAGIAERMRTNERMRLQLRSYASGTADTAREARQLSLARALALRERLTAFGVRSTRIDVRALGADAGDGPPDRIDVEFLNE